MTQPEERHNLPPRDKEFILGTTARGARRYRPTGPARERADGAAAMKTFRPGTTD